MLDPKRLREDEKLRERILLRGGEIDLAGFVAADEKRRALLAEVENLRAEQNRLSAEIGKRKRDGADAAHSMEELKALAARLKEGEARLEAAEADWSDRILRIPNVPNESVPTGTSAEENQVVRVWGEAPRLSFEPRPHWEIGERLGILDFARGAKIAGARFTVLTDGAAKLERALINFMLDLHTREHGYREVMPPFLANAESFLGTGNLPKFEADLFKLQDWNLYLVPTAEVPVTNLYRDEILRGEDLPIKFAAYTPCFRSEAGAAGKDTRGLIRQHQFNKVELVKFSHPDASYDELERLTGDAEDVLKRLGLHYRVVLLCTGDMGFSSAKTYDLEVWLPSDGGMFREISSCSNFEDFQARRAKIRFREGPKGKPRLVHTLNGSGLAIGRTLAAIFENYQQEDGTVLVPEALQPYLGGLDRIGPAPGAPRR